MESRRATLFPPSRCSRVRSSQRASYALASSWTRPPARARTRPRVPAATVRASSLLCADWFAERAGEASHEASASTRHADPTHGSIPFQLVRRSDVLRVPRAGDTHEDGCASLTPIGPVSLRAPLYAPRGVRVSGGRADFRLFRCFARFAFPATLALSPSPFDCVRAAVTFAQSTSPPRRVNSRHLGFPRCACNSARFRTALVQPVCAFSRSFVATTSTQSSSLTSRSPRARLTPTLRPPWQRTRAPTPLQASLLRIRLLTRCPSTQCSTRACHAPCRACRICSRPCRESSHLPCRYLRGPSRFHMGTSCTRAPFGGYTSSRRITGNERG